jgi:hypothetical protein
LSSHHLFRQQAEAAARAGQIFHIRRYPSSKGMTLTGIARYFVWKPSFIEGYNRYWRVDCFVKVHPLAPEPMMLGEALVAALVRENLCAEPIWLSAHVLDREMGRAFGKVFEDD